MDNPWDEPVKAHRPWVAIYLPLLPKVFLDAERAEVVGRTWVNSFRGSALYSGTTVDVADRRPDPLDRSTLRTFLTTSSAFKEGLAARSVPSELAQAYRRAPMPRYIWVIEVVDRMRRAAGEPDVLGEILLDSTLTQFEPLHDQASVLALHMDSTAFLTGADYAQGSRPAVPPGTVYGSACRSLRR